MLLKEVRITMWLGSPTNCYIVMDEKTKEAMVIDPAGSIDKIEQILKDENAQLKYIYLTHCHADHIIGAESLKQRCGGKILIHKDDYPGLQDSIINLSIMVLGKDYKMEADEVVEENQVLKLGDLEFRVIHTPGHTKGGSCLYCEQEKCLFSGDTMFKGTYGRTDLPSSSQMAIEASIEKLLKLPGDTMVYPGHGSPTTIAAEAANWTADLGLFESCMKC